MAQKIINMPGIGEVILQKRKGMRSIRLSIGHDGRLRVSMPNWSPYKAGEAFALSRGDWIRQNQAGRATEVLLPNTRVGKWHRLRFVYEDRATITSRVTTTELIIRLPQDRDATEAEVQTIVRAGAVRALKQEAKKLLPPRLRALATKHGFSYKSVAIKQLKSRWGSCSSNRDIGLNCYLMQLPWELIDYVLLHELTHTRVMAHGRKFWDELGRHVSDLPAKRKAIKAHRPNLLSLSN